MKDYFFVSSSADTATSLYYGNILISDYNAFCKMNDDFDDCSFDTLKKNFKECLTAPLESILPSTGDPRLLSVPALLEHIFNDFAIELFDYCLQLNSPKFISTGTAVEDFGYTHEKATLNSHLNNYYTQRRPAVTWNSFFAMNTKFTDAGCRISTIGGPAIIASLDIEKRLKQPLSEAPNDFSEFASNYAIIRNMISEKREIWKCLLSKYPHASASLSIYHLEKLWHFAYIHKLIESLARMQAGFYCYPACRKDKTSLTFFPCGTVTHSDFTVIFNVIECLQQYSPCLLTNNFLTEYIISSTLDLNMYHPTLFYFICSEVIPTLRKYLYDYVLRRCTSMSVLPNDIAQNILNKCTPYANLALDQYYSFVPPTITIGRSKTNYKLIEHGLKTIYSILYPLLEETPGLGSPREAREHLGL